MNEIMFLKNLYISEISLVNRYIEPIEKYPFKNRGRFHHCFMYTLSGTEIYCFNNRKIHAVPGSVLYIPKDEKYTIKLDGNVSTVITVDFDTTNNESYEPFCIKFAVNDKIHNIFEEIEKNWIENKDDSMPIIKSQFYNIVALLIKHKNIYSNSTNYQKIKKSIEYLHGHYTESDFRIETLFEIAKISPRYFETLFFKEFKQTPKEYITALKIKLAKELLLSGRYSVGDVAVKSGYSDVYHFSKVFKAKTGYTPSDFKKQEYNI